MHCTQLLLLLLSSTLWFILTVFLFVFKVKGLPQFQSQQSNFEVGVAYDPLTQNIYLFLVVLLWVTVFQFIIGIKLLTLHFRKSLRHNF